jgi:hypothetical protein
MRWPQFAALLALSLKSLEGKARSEFLVFLFYQSLLPFVCYSVSCGISLLVDDLTKVVPKTRLLIATPIHGLMHPTSIQTQSTATTVQNR